MLNAKVLFLFVLLSMQMLNDMLAHARPPPSSTEEMDAFAYELFKLERAAVRLRRQLKRVEVARAALKRGWCFFVSATVTKRLCLQRNAATDVVTRAGRRTSADVSVKHRLSSSRELRVI